MDSKILIISLLAVFYGCLNPNFASAEDNFMHRVVSPDRAENSHFSDAHDTPDGENINTVPIIFRYPFSSNQLKRGDAVQVEVAQDVYSEDTLIFKKGTEGYLFIKACKPGRLLGRSGYIEIASGKIADVFGNMHDLQIADHIKGNSEIAPKLLPLLGYYYPPLGLLTFYGLKKGGDAVIPAGKVIFASTAPSSIDVSYSKNKASTHSESLSFQH